MKLNEKNLLLFVTLLFLSNSYAQSYPKGIYKTINEIVTKKPSSDITLDIEKRTLGEIKMSGGNDYRLTSNTGVLSRKEIKKKILAYSNGDTLFINCHKYKVQNWYSPVLNNGRFLFFLGGISQDQNLFNFQLQESKTSTGWGFFGGIGGGIQGAKLAQLRFPYLIDSKTNELIYFDENALEKILAEINIELLNRYRNEKQAIDNSNDEQTKLLMLKYLELINENS